MGLTDSHFLNTHVYAANQRNGGIKNESCIATMYVREVKALKHEYSHKVCKSKKAHGL